MKALIILERLLSITSFADITDCTIRMLNTSINYQHIAISIKDVTNITKKETNMRLAVARFFKTAVVHFFIIKYKMSQELVTIFKNSGTIMVDGQ